jgi:hypothetical protein
MLPPGEELEFIVEKDKAEKIKRVVAHNDGEVVDEATVDGDVRFKIRKLQPAEVP